MGKKRLRITTETLLLQAERTSQGDVESVERKVEREKQAGLECGRLQHNTL